MLHVEIEELQQRYPLNGGKVVTYAVLLLPNQKRISVALESDDVESLLEANGDSPAETQQPPQTYAPAEEPGSMAFGGDPVEMAPTFNPPPADMSLMTQPEVSADSFADFLETGESAAVQPPQFEGAQQAPQSNEQQVTWAELPDDVLPRQMKDVLIQVGAAPVMPVAALQNLVDEISERMSNQAQAQGVLAQPPAPPQPRPQPVQQPVRQPVQPVMGQVQLQPVPQRRTVPMNTAGYPVVPGMEQDPGEIAVNADEDGVSQL